MSKSINPDILQALQKEMQLPDSDIDIANVALLLAWADQPDISLERYQNHLAKIAAETKRIYEGLLKTEPDSAALRLQVIRNVVYDQEGFRGDQESYDDLQNASLIRVIERRKGLPIVLAILCIRCGFAMGWDVFALMIPGHVLCRIDFGAERLIFDPFEHAKIMEAKDLRALVKRIQGPQAEISASYFELASPRDVLIRLQNNLKYRRIDLEDYEGALRAVELMRLIDPNEYRLLLDAGVLYARVGQSKAAISSLEVYLERAPYDQDRYEASLLLEDLKATLN